MSRIPRDYTNYRTSRNVHCVLFREEQAAYLAGYAAVREGNTSMAVLGGEPLPSTVRYATGFVQGSGSRSRQHGRAGVYPHLVQQHDGQR